jgi:hypothetical protein
MERRLAHLGERLGATFDRVRRRNAGRRRMDNGDSAEIPV